MLFKMVFSKSSICHWPVQSKLIILKCAAEARRAFGTELFPKNPRNEGIIFHEAKLLSAASGKGSHPDPFAQAIKHQPKLKEELSSSNIIKPPFVEAWDTGIVRLFNVFTQLKTYQKGQSWLFPCIYDKVFDLLIFPLS